MATGKRMRTHGRQEGRPTPRARGGRGLAAAAAALTGVVLAGTTLVLSGAVGTAGATSSHVQTIHISTTKVANVGTVLTTGSGLTLYRFTQDPAGTATCTGACAKIWPPLLASKGAHIAGPKGMKGLSLIKVTGGHWQVAFHHVALYRFEGDKKKGQAKGQGVESAWYAVLKSGIPATASVSPAVSTPTTQAPTTTTQAPHAVTTSPPATQAPATQTPATVAPTPSPTTTPPTQPPPTTTPTTSPPTTTPTTTGGGGYGY